MAAKRGERGQPMPARGDETRAQIHRRRAGRDVEVTRIASARRPLWLRWTWRMIVGLRRKHRDEYRSMARRLIEAWPEVAGAFERVCSGALATKSGQRVYTDSDAGRVCAVVLEAFAWWAVEERAEVGDIRAAERELLQLQATIDASVTALRAAVRRTDEIRSRFGLCVDAPTWHDDLGSAMQEAAHRFGRWGLEPAVSRYIAFELHSFFTPRPRVTDLLAAARSVGFLQSDIVSPVRHPVSGEWVRTAAPSVKAVDGQSHQALAVRAGSSPHSEAAQLRQLFATLKRIALDHGWDDGAVGPLEWLTDADISTLCCAMVGGRKTLARPWGEPAEAFDSETVRKARDAFNKSDRKSWSTER